MIALAAALALVAAALFAVAAVAQQRAAAAVPKDRVGGLRLVLTLARRPLWWVGTLADVGGYAAQAAALGLGSLLLVQPRPQNIDGFTPEQRFFLAYAHNWATNIRPEYARFLVSQDPHPLSKFRANGPLSNMPQFAEAFQCKVGSPMVRPEAKRCQIW